jgi:DNA-binding HxlR family transcriptional regulator
MLSMTWDRDAFSADNCSVARTLQVVGERWTMLVLREAFYGVRRFDDIQRGTGAPRNVLTERLKTLVHHGLLERVPYQEPGVRRRFEYVLTGRGRELLPALVALMQWGDRHLADPDGPPVVLRHRDCGALVHAVLACDAGHTRLTARDTRPELGPGARAASA